jgi:hypothetical protein
MKGNTKISEKTLPIVEPFNVAMQLGVCRLNIESLTKVKYVGEEGRGRTRKDEGGMRKGPERGQRDKGRREGRDEGRTRKGRGRDEEGTRGDKRGQRGG